MLHRPRGSVAASAATAALGLVLGAVALAGCANGPDASALPPIVAGPSAAAPPPPTAPSGPGVFPLYGESASFEFDPTAERHLESTQTEWRNQEPTLGQLPGRSDGRDTLIMPITGGTVALGAGPPRGRIITNGSAILTRGGSLAQFTDLVLDLDAGHVDATLDGRPITLLDLDLSRAHRDDEPHLPPEIVDIEGHISANARREIRERTGTDFSEDTSRMDIEVRMKLSP